MNTWIFAYLQVAGACNQEGWTHGYMDTWITIDTMDNSKYMDACTPPGRPCV
jgi:hypothetical protein